MIKKLFFFVFLSLFTGVTATAQITLENTYDFSASTGYIDGEGYKYYEMDTDNQQCVIYNLDHTLYEVIDLEVPSGQYLYDLKYVTNHLFDQDDEIEVCYTYYEYNTAEAYSTYTTRVINADGSELLNVPGAGYATLMTTSETGDYRFVLYVYDYSVVPSTVQTNVYSVNGQSTGMAEQLQTQYPSKAFPNPANESVQINYTLPQNIQGAQLEILDASGRILARMPVQTDRNHIRFNSSDFPSGSYVYRIGYENTILIKDKIVIKH